MSSHGTTVELIGGPLDGTVVPFSTELVKLEFGRIATSCGLGSSTVWTRIYPRDGYPIDCYEKSDVRRRGFDLAFHSSVAQKEYLR